MIRILTTLILSFSMVFAFAQTPERWCGMNQAESDLLIKQTAESIRLAEQGLTLRSGMITWVPVKWHIVANNSGALGISETEVFEQMCAWNDFYADQDIQFYIDESGFNYINSTAALNDPRTGGGLLQLTAAKQNHGGGRMNAFIVQAAGSIDNGDPNPDNWPSAAGYYSPANDWIVIRKNDVQLSNETMNHEAGHFFGISHTFRGWDFLPYNIGIHGNQAPAFSPNPQVRTENQDRTGSCSNCQTAGDLLCDTNPDYQLNVNFHTNNCDYNGDILDPCGVEVQPNVDNVMSYFFGCNLQEFTTQQKAVISANLNNRLQVGTINRNLEPARIADVEAGDITVISPMEGEVLTFNNVAHLDWEDVPGATKYVIDVDRFSSFGVQQERFFSDFSGLTLEDLNENDDYYWRVYPYNTTSTCAGWSQVNSFTTGSGVTAVESISAIDKFTISPNPVNNQSAVNVRLNVSETFDGTLSIRDITGRLVMERAESFNAGNNNFEFSTRDLQNGIYLVSVRTETGVNTAKLIVSK